MPELPEVETVVRGLRPFLQGQRLDRLLLRRADMRFPFPEGLSQRVSGKTMASIERRAKYGLIRFDHPEPLSLLFHLGMSGRMVCEEEVGLPFEKHDHVIFETAKGQVRFNDPRRFGFLDLIEGPDDENRFLGSLGPEPLGEQVTPAYLRTAFKDRASPIKASLLNQRLIAGLGNIYVCEALFESGIRPTRKTGSLKRAEVERLCTAIKGVLSRAIEAGGSSLRDYKQVSGELGYFQHAWSVYGRENDDCRTCDAPIKRIVQSNRSTFYCAACQR
ncbi:MAG: bifunctional DNA-formamidopyrimidine glycosylase/DNA-(apurinic or apyrimidinic site) lyase [Alphaproteobacteria bacterium TMED89]|nr:DNA-formamidopyrimidine glycosylase [Rhodospirillaceae bacterium]RPH14945.1 MAG: bifunctional DNA-formamidopyrimidine glycosylase/DNA-(apurinic or apyrimidinic site) lyase [Alphaproteobacteria bacterium TMED89]